MSKSETWDISNALVFDKTQYSGGHCEKKNSGTVITGLECANSDCCTHVYPTNGNLKRNNRNYGSRNENISSVMDASNLLLEVTRLLHHDQERSTCICAEPSTSNKPFVNKVVKMGISPVLSGFSEPPPALMPSLSSLSLAEGKGGMCTGFGVSNLEHAERKLKDMGEENIRNRQGAIQNMTAPVVVSARLQSSCEGQKRNVFQYQQESPHITSFNHINNHKRNRANIRDNNTDSSDNVHVSYTHKGPRVTFSEPLAGTSAIYYNPLPTAEPKDLTDSSYSHCVGRRSENDNHDDMDDIYDTLLCLKETRRLCRMQPKSHVDKENSSKGKYLQQSKVLSPFYQKLNLSCCVYSDTTEALEEAIKLLLQERKWVMRRCAILYERLQQLKQHHNVIVNRLNVVHGENLSCGE